MTANISRRSLVAGTTAGITLLSASRQLGATQSETTKIESGGIGWPREVFDQKFGKGSEWDELTIYPNPYVDDSQLSVLFENEIATFIDMSIPGDNVNTTNIDGLLGALLPEDATSEGRWDINPVEGSPFWKFEEFHAASMNMAGSGATRMMLTTAITDDQLIRATISLATPDAGSGFVPADNSVGVGSSIDEWIDAWGEGYDGHGAMGTYDGTWNIEPWNKVIVFSQRSQGGNAVITQIDALSFDGVDVESSIDLAESILPQQSQLLAGYSSYAVKNRNQGWGMSTWNLSEHERLILCMIGAGDDSGNVLQVASALYRSQI